MVPTVRSTSLLLGKEIDLGSDKQNGSHICRLRGPDDRSLGGPGGGQLPRVQ